MNRERRVEIRKQARHIRGMAAWVRSERNFEVRDFKRRPSFAQAANRAEYEAAIAAFTQASEKLDEAAALLRAIAMDQPDTQQQLASGLAGMETYRTALAELAKR